MPKMKCERCSKIFQDEELLSMHMRSQHPDRDPTDTELDVAARKALYEFLTSDGKDPALLQKAKQANAHRSNEAKKDQTQSAKQATLVMMARELAESKADFRELIQLALPHTAMLSALKKKELAH